jgi:hypothetical protein
MAALSQSGISPASNLVPSKLKGVAQEFELWRLISLTRYTALHLAQPLRNISLRKVGI